MSVDHRSHKAKVPWHRNPVVLGYIYQALLIALVLSLGYYLYSNTVYNMDKRNIKTGFGFLEAEAGFGIVLSLIEYNETHTFGRTFLVGLLNTALVSVLGIFFATILGFTMGIARLSRNWIIARIAKVYIEVFRNIPLLVQILFWYALVILLPNARNAFGFAESFFLSNRGFYMPSPVLEDGFGAVFFAFLVACVGVYFLSKWAKKRQDETGEQFPVFLTSSGILIVVTGVVFFIMGSPLSWDLPALKGFNFRGGWIIIPELIALLFALTIYTGTFIAETVRAGIMAVPHGQTEASRALGFKPGISIRLIILPQALKVIVPPLTSQYLNLTKNSSLATAIGYPDLFSVFAGTTLNQTGQAVEIIAMTMGVYLSLSLFTSLLMNIYNRRVALIER